MDKRTRRQIEWAFYNYEANKALGAEQVKNIAKEGLTAQLDRIGFGGNVGSPTESKALKICERAKQYLWAKVVENTLAAFRFEPEYEVMVALYIDGKRYRELCDDGLWERTLFRWRERWLEYAYKWAQEFNIL